MKTRPKPALVSLLFHALSSALPQPPFPTRLPLPSRLNLGQFPPATEGGCGPSLPVRSLQRRLLASGHSGRPPPTLRWACPPSRPGSCLSQLGDGSPTEILRELCSFRPLPPQAPYGGPTFWPLAWSALGGSEGELPRGRGSGPTPSAGPRGSASPASTRVRPRDLSPRAGDLSDPCGGHAASRRAPRGCSLGGKHGGRLLPRGARALPGLRSSPEPPAPGDPLSSPPSATGAPPASVAGHERRRRGRKAGDRRGSRGGGARRDPPPAPSCRFNPLWAVSPPPDRAPPRQPRCAALRKTTAGGGTRGMRAPARGEAARGRGAGRGGMG